jgi:hypothetical protein
MNTSTSDINAEMRRLADYAVRTAKERYNLDLDYSDQSISRLETILEKIYWGFSDRREEGEGGLVYSTATIWGSYLGEFMIRRWGGNWFLKDSKPLVVIKEIEFAPIRLVYQKILGSARDKVGDYLFEVNRQISPIMTIRPQEPYPSLREEVFVEQIDEVPVKKDSRINKKLFALFGAGAAILAMMLLLVIGFMRILNSDLPASGADPVLTSTNSPSPTSTASLSPSPTITTLPTYTPKPSATSRPSNTPTNTATSTPTATMTNSPTPTPRRTRIPTRTPTSTFPPNTPIAPSSTPTPTTPPPPPVVIESCSVNPSTIDPGVPATLEFSAHFSAPGYGFSVSLDPGYFGSTGCNAQDDNGDGTASCQGSSGILPSQATVNVTFKSAVGDCSSSYHTP